jgi:hypothetical protein
VRLVQLCGPFIGYISEHVTRVEVTHILSGMPESREITLFVSSSLKKSRKNSEGILTSLVEQGQIVFNIVF